MGEDADFGNMTRCQLDQGMSSSRGFGWLPSTLTSEAWTVKWGEYGPDVLVFSWHIKAAWPFMKTSVVSDV